MTEPIKTQEGERIPVQTVEIASAIFGVMAETVLPGCAFKGRWVFEAADRIADKIRLRDSSPVQAEHDVWCNADRSKPRHAYKSGCSCLLPGETLEDRKDAPVQAAGDIDDAAEMLWTVIANVSGGDWKKQSEEWQEAAARWRDYYFKSRRRHSTGVPNDKPVQAAGEETYPDIICPTCGENCAGECVELASHTAFNEAIEAAAKRIESFGETFFAVEVRKMKKPGQEKVEPETPDKVFRELEEKVAEELSFSDDIPWSDMTSIRKDIYRDNAKRIIRVLREAGRLKEAGR